ncbi:alanine racemase [soil metagenome]
MNSVTSDLRTWAEIDLSAIRHNLCVARSKIGPKPGIVAVVKANAYGHGMIEVATALADQVELFGVANVEEARELVHLGREILLLSPSLPAERREIVERGFIASVSSAKEASSFAGGRINFKVDTGMGRMGTWQDEAVEELRAIIRLGNVSVHSVSTHLPVPDEDAAFTQAELAGFAALAETFRTFVPGVRIHALNSAGILGFGDYGFDLVRPGLLLYGSAYPSTYQSLLRPALAWKTRILLVREVDAGRSVSYGRTFTTRHPTKIASLAVGYADGFPRQASGQGAHVLIGGRRCPVLGRVTMDQILVDVSEVPAAQASDEAVLIGWQGSEEIIARELADQAGTITWNIFTGLGNRVKRIYLNQS